MKESFTLSRIRDRIEKANNEQEDNRVKKEEIRHELLVIGGGASGIMAAITAARSGIDTAILEHTDRIGRKLLATGNGRCNLTNLVQKPECYRSQEPQKAWKVISAFSEQDTITFFEELGLLTREKGGYVYPYSNQAASLLRCLKSELYRLHVPVYYRTQLVRAGSEQGRFVCETAGKCYYGKKLILAAGSKAAPATGSDGSGYELAKVFGHTVTPVLPALVQLTAGERCFERLSGIRTEAVVSLFCDGEKMACDTGELQLTEYGISGIPVFQVSRYAAEGLEKGKHVTAELDFCPVLPEDKLTQWIENRVRMGIRIREALAGVLNEKLAEFLTEGTDISGKADLTGQQLRMLVSQIKHFDVTITGTKGFEHCQVCMGGVPLSEIDTDSMESRLVRGLYFAGEILDVDGICGGYNLQWAWASGYLAGRLR